MKNMARQATERLPSSLQRGVVVSFDDEKGYGFIRPQGDGKGQPDVFVHMRNVEGRRRLAPGQPVSYYLTRTAKGPAAIKVNPGSSFNTPYVRYSLIGLGTAILLLVFLSQAVSAGGLGVWLGLWVIAVSISAAGIYAYDKAQAGRGGTRVPEVVLHGLSLLGGSPGAFIAMRLFHHKTAKQSFQLVFWLIVAVQVAVVVFLLSNRQLLPGVLIRVLRAS